MGKDDQKSEQDVADTYIIARLRIVYDDMLVSISKLESKFKNLKGK